MVIGPAANPYLFRWYLWPRNRRCNLYLHRFLRDDEDRALHDHPWWFVSLVISGSYAEVVPSGTVQRHRFSIAFRRALHRHRVVLPRDSRGLPVPCWTIVLTGRRQREWGFWCPRGFVPWQVFTKPENPGEVGRGCD